MSHYEIFILNYKGERYLYDCLNSLENLNLGDNKVVVNVVDNGSNDNSHEIVRNFKNVNYFPLGKNLGFSTGNNKGVKVRLEQLDKSPDYLLFLNNDTKVENDLILKIDDTFRSNAEIGIVGVKSLFMDDFIPISFEFDTDYINVVVQADNVGSDFRRYRAFKGSHSGEGTWRIRKGGCLFVPIRDIKISTKIRIASHNLSNVKLSILDKFYRKDNQFVKEFSKQGRFSLNQEIIVEPEAYVKLIQNAGSFVTSSYEAGDMGSFEIDSGQYSNDTEINAVCGVAMAIKSELFQELGGFDQHFFAYFEDTDLSLRARRRGYKCYFSSNAIINHVHAGSSGVETDYFKFNVTYSRLYFLSKYAPKKIFKKRLAELRFNSSNEFEAYLMDNQSEDKPNLRAEAKYIKYYFKFLFNRLSKFFYKDVDDKICKTLFKEKYVNEF